MMSDPIRILIADDHPLFREGVALSLSREPDLEIVGEASSGEEAFILAGDLLPDVLLLDIVMPGMGGIAAARRIAAAWPVICIMMLTVSEDNDDLLAALKAGARGYVLKGVGARELANAVRTVAHGSVYVSPALASGILFEMARVPAQQDPLNSLTEREISPALASGILFEMARVPAQQDPLNSLTERERDILNLVAEGLTNREIGERLHLAEKTVKHYMTNVLHKLQVRSRVEAALLAQKRGTS
jgi:two-component system, NarL family, nitrate/nitrite response regulator NarL